MRIGIDIKAFKNGSTGIARYLRSIMDNLQKIDRENDYFLFECTLSDYNITNPRWKKIFIPWKLPGILWQQFVLTNHLIRHKIELLWAPEQICPIYTNRTIKIITTIHDLVAFRYPKTCQWSNLWIQKLLLKKAIIRSNVIAPVSDYVKREVDALFGNELKNTLNIPVYNGSPKWSLPTNYSFINRKDFLFFPGNLEPRKNLRRLISALELLFQRYGLQVPLHLSGPVGWRNQSLHSLIEKSSVKNFITHLGYLSESELKTQYLSCKALVYPSLYEGFGLPVLEALTLDCPVLTSKGTVMEEIAGSAAIYFDAGSVESIAQTIKLTYEPEFDRNDCLNRKSAVLERFSWDQSARKLLSLFKQPT